MPIFVVADSSNALDRFSLCNVSSFEDAAVLHFKKVELLHRHKYCMTTGKVEMTVHQMDLIGPLCGAKKVRRVSVERVAGQIVAVTEEAHPVLSLFLTGPKSCDPTI